MPYCLFYCLPINIMAQTCLDKTIQSINHRKENYLENRFSLWHYILFYIVFSSIYHSGAKTKTYIFYYFVDVKMLLIKNKIIQNRKYIVQDQTNENGKESAL